ncbi:BZ3500_MvSof-1268-A1-R1_Chr3-1g05686 [Microbotryum saponariae]|uniref:BZ3500_MvSof-1268-A1-R1_Chr3-1g05686 protein n=1 Tax=Microbotryum saponariae TaxID=289078 RepID=A0A2X0L241_9BASI|nr:BZ3500_MvSof-1268-A1-R1_Chr3-1g05686 [Microbotryum saponariae]SDA04876.1 BZ3501_MvSof-1269-A2-R1_Chr3-1g05356 [Microbotryum saponariae]
MFSTVWPELARTFNNYRPDWSSAGSDSAFEQGADATSSYWKLIFMFRRCGLGGELLETKLVDLDNEQSKMIQAAVSVIGAKHKIAVMQGEARTARRERASDSAEAPLARDGTNAVLRSFQVLRSSPHPFDVCFKFKDDDTEVWESSSFLAAKSKYFKTLFDSELAEKVLKTVGDDQLCQQARHLVEVTEYSSSVYQAVFTWLRTGLVKFAPLGDTQKGTEPDSQVIGEIECDVTALSVYRLGHHLQLLELVELTLAWVDDNLSPDNVIFELSRDWTGLPTEMKEKILAFAVANWDDVRRSKHTTSVLKTIIGQGHPSVALIELLLLALKVEYQEVGLKW